MATDAFSLALRWLATRELSRRQLEERLRKRGFADEEIGDTLERLRRDGALDDRRVALAYARTAARVKHRGRERVLKEIEGLGVARADARAAVEEVFAELDERELIDRALARRLRGRIASAAQFARHYRFLVRQGYTPAIVVARLKAQTGRRVALDQDQS